MKIEVQGGELFDRVGDLKVILDATDGEPITLSASADGTDKGIVTVRGRSGRSMAELKICARVLEPGEAAVRFRDLNQACLAFLRRMVVISADELYMYIECEPERVTIETAPKCEPLFKSAADAPRAVFDSADILAVMSDVVHAQCNEPQYRPSLCGINFEVGTDMKLRAVATDGRRIAVSARQMRRADLPKPDFAAFLPRAATEFLARVSHGEDVAIIKLNRGIRIETNGGSVNSWNDTTFPNWRTCVPENPAYRATFNGGELADAIFCAINALDTLAGEVDEEGDLIETSFRAHIYAGKASNRAKITVTKAGEVGGNSKFFTTVSCATPDGAGFTTDVNARYLHEAVLCQEGAVEVYADPISKRFKQLAPLVFKFPDAPDLFEVVMPIRTN